MCHLELFSIFANQLNQTFKFTIMKKYLSLIVVLATAFQMQAWKPLMVGHRGSSIGVENTRESFINGVEIKGYDGLECDVRVTKDGVYVISHDETTNRVGGALTVAEATYEALAAETYSQTRSGVTYSGKICTVAEYLDICVEKNVFPVIELKWATGINNNDMSNFPGLMKLVTDRGLEKKVVFLTSMQNSLLYIRKNYPEVKCQFLCTSLATSKVDWCKENGLEPSISVGYFDQQLLLKYHKAGMNAACWVVDSEANYKKYAEMGVYMITSNSLVKSELPEVEEVDWDAIPEELEPLNITFTEVWSRTVAKDNLPTNFPAGTNTTYKTGQQAAFVDGKFIISDYGTSKLLTIDKDCTEATISDGYPMHGITTDDADNLIQRGEAGYSSKPSVVYITKKGETTPVKVEFSIPADATGQTNFVAAMGDVFSSEGGYVYVYPNGQKIVYAIHIANGEYKGMETYPNLSIAASTAGIIIPYSDSDPAKFIYMVRNQGFYRYDNGDKGAILTGASTTAPARNSSLGGAFFSLDGHELLVHPSGKNYSGGFSIKDVSAGNATLATVAELGTTASAYGSNPSVGSFFRAVPSGTSQYDLYFYTMGFGYGLYRIKSVPSSVESIGTDNEVKITFIDRDHLRIDSSNSDEITVFSVSGSVMMRQRVDESNIVDITSLNPGVYILAAGNKAAKIMKR